MTQPTFGVQVSKTIDGLCDRFEREWKRGGHPRIEDYLADGQPDKLLFELIYLDCYYRRCSDDVPTVAEYAKRFPGLSPERLSAAVSDTLPNPGNRFRLIAQVGSGAFGVVWRAMDTKLNRLVALKIPHPGPGSGPEALERFRREAQAAARLRHPGIAPVHDVAEVNGQPALVAEFVAGDTLTEVLARRKPTPAEAAAVVAALADALDYAHSMGAVHRDVKPSNVLVVPDMPETLDGGMSALAGFGRPVLVDFGLALQEGSGDATLTTRGQVLGTPVYMSPEQAAGQAHTADRRSDVYSLGAVLYEMLTGRPPFAGDRAEVLEKVRTADPPAPRVVDRNVPRDLETVCQKAMAKEPAHRYRTAAALADDLRRFLHGEPVRARPLWAWERSFHWLRRRPTLAALLAVSGVAAVLTAGVGLLVERTITLARAHAAEVAERQTAETMRQVAETALYYNRVALASQELEKNNVGYVRQLLDECPVSLRGWEWRYMRKRCSEHTLSFVHSLPARTGLTYSVVAVAYSPDGRTLATGSWEGLVNLWDADTGELRGTLGEAAGGMALAFSPDGRSLVTGNKQGVVRVWDVNTGARTREWRTRDPVVYTVAFSPDGETVAAGTGPDLWVADDAGAGKIVLWDIRSGAERLRLDSNHRRVTSVAFRPDGWAFAAAYGSWYNSPYSAAPGGVTVWDLPDGRPIQELKGHGEAIAAVAWSPDGKLLATAGWDQVARVYDAESWTERHRFEGHQDWVRGVVWSPNGREITTVSSDNGVRIWDSTTGRLKRLLRGHTQAVSAVAWRPDGDRLATVGSDGTVKIWNLTLPNDPVVCRPFATEPIDLAFSASGDSLVSAGPLLDQPQQLALCSFDPATGFTRSTTVVAAPPHLLVDSVPRIRGEIGPGADKIAVRQQRATIKLFDLQGGKVRWTTTEKAGAVNEVRLSPDGRAVVGVGYMPRSPATLFVCGWDVETGKNLPFDPAGVPGAVAAAAFHPCSRMLAVSCENQLTIWDMVSFKMVSSFLAHERMISAIEFSADGSRLATVSWDTTAKVWDTAALSDQHPPMPLLTLRGHMRNLTGVTWEPSGFRLATCSEDRSVKLWDTRTGQQAVTLVTDADLLTRVRWSPDSRRIAAADRSGAVTIWDASPDQ